MSKIERTTRFVYLSIIALLGLHLLFRFFDQSRLIWLFPLDFTNDLSSYLAQLYFLKVCGFHHTCPYWYNGFVSFLVTSPGWFMFAYPLYAMTASVTAAAYISTIFLYILGTVFSFFLGKRAEFSTLEALAFFFLIFGNALSLGNFLRQGRVLSLMAFVFFLALLAFVLEYRKKDIDVRFLIGSSLIFAIILLTHYQEAILVPLLFVSLFLSKKRFTQKILVSCAPIISLLLTSWWWVPFATTVFRTRLISNEQAQRLLVSSGESLLSQAMTFIVPLSLFVLFFLYLKNRDDTRTEVLFFLPILLMSFLYLTRLILFIPLLRNIAPDSYILFLLPFILFFMFSLVRSPHVSLKMRNLLLFALFSITLFSITFNTLETPFIADRTPLEQEVLSLFPLIDGPFLILNADDSSLDYSYNKAYYSYAPIYHNLTTPLGWYPHVTTETYLTEITTVVRSYLSRDCESLRASFQQFNVTYLISYTSSCDFLSSCGLIRIEQKDHACLYSLS